MTRDVVTIAPDMTLTELDRVLVSENVSGGPVVEDSAVVGVVSRADVIRVLYDEQRAAANVSGFYGSPYPIPIPALHHLARDSRRIADEMTRTCVREIMSRDVKSVGPDEEVEAVARMMVARGYHRVPVIDDGRLVGIVSSLDIVRLVGRVGLGAA